MRGKRAAQRSGRHRGATAIAGDRNECRSPRSLPGSASVSPACAPDARVPRVSGRPTSPFAPCGSIAGRSQSRATEMNFGLRWRRLGARSSRPPARRRRAHPGHLRGARASHPPARRRRAHSEHQNAQTPPSPHVGEGSREMRGKRAAQQRDHRLRRASSRMACRLRISATSYLVGIEPAIGRIFTIAGNCPERP